MPEPVEPHIHTLIDAALTNQTLVGSVDLNFGDVTIRVETNRTELAEHLGHYFRAWRAPVGTPDIRVLAIDTDPGVIASQPLDYRDWEREPGKLLKERFVDLDGGRVVHKVRTGLYLLLSEGRYVAFGPCLKNANQVINLVVAQYMNHGLRQRAALCHAAGLFIGGQGVGIAAVSGGGKSTTMLKLLNAGGVFCSNDRLLVRRAETGWTMTGVPKMPRVNPGTLLNNPKLHAILPPARAEALKRLSKPELWELEEKYDVDVERIYGPGRMLLHGALHAFIVLTWSHDADDAPCIERVSLSERREFLRPIMKNGGPFYEGPGHSRMTRMSIPPESDYLEFFGDLPVYGVSGRADFPWLVERIQGLAKAGWPTDEDVYYRGQ